MSAGASGPDPDQGALPHWIPAKGEPLEPFILVVEQEGPTRTITTVTAGPSCSTTNGEISKGLAL